MFPFKVMSLVVVCMVPVHNADGAVFCNKTLVQHAWKRCNIVYLPDDNDEDVKEICENMDCHLQCYIDAIGDCDGSGEFVSQFLQYDARKWQVYYRIACSNQAWATELGGEERKCPEVENCQLDDFTSNSSLSDLYKQGKYDEYKKQLCSYFAKSRSCISVMQSENCSAANAKFYEDIKKVGSSVSFCENADIKQLYTKFGGDVKCVNPKVDSQCFRLKVRSRVSKCSDLAVQSLDYNSIPAFCQSLECNLKCYENAVGKCFTDSDAGNLMMDPAATKVSTRAVCEQKDEFIAALQECGSGKTSCYTELSTAVATADDLFVQENYEASKQTVCSGASKFRACMKYVASGKCTAEMVSLLNNITEVSYSYAGCGQQNNAYFSKYNYDTKCDTSGSGKPVASFFVFFALLYSEFYLFFSLI